MKFLLPARLLILASALALCVLPSCGGSSGGSGGGSGGGTGGGSGGGSTSYTQPDLAGDWTGHLSPKTDNGLPWAGGEKRILSRNIFVRGNGSGDFTFAQDGSDQIYELGQARIKIVTTSITKAGYFSVTFKQTLGSRSELVLVGQLNSAKNYITGYYELRVHTKPGQANQIEAVDAGTFWLSLSSGSGHFNASMFEGKWEGFNYHYAPRYLNCVMEIDAVGNLSDGAMMDKHGFIERRFARDGSNDGLFTSFSDSSVGLFSGATIAYQGGRELKILFLLMDETRTWLTGPAIDINGQVSYLRLKRTSI
ncbi:MAG: hypothetical protein H8E15_11735 [Planctomycetes bacterium]|nr:hypothetical protein [Planctomycetota bacterium]